MRCDTARENLKAYSDRELDPVTAWRARRHLYHCAGCAAELASLQRLHDLLLAAEVVPDAASAVTASPSESPLHRTSRRWRRPLVLAAAGLAGAAVAAALLLPLTDPRESDQREIAVNQRDSRTQTPSSSHEASPDTDPTRRKAPSEDNTRPAPAPPSQNHGTSDRGSTDTPSVSGAQQPAPPPRLPSQPDLQPRQEVPTPPVRPNSENVGEQSPRENSDIDTTPEERLSPGGERFAHTPPIQNPKSKIQNPDDLLFLNDGRLAAAQPFAPLPEIAPLPVVPPPLVQQRPPGSVVVEDLLHLNPIRVAEAGLDAAVRTIDAATPASDERLQQKVVVHATYERLADLLARLSQATGVQMLPRIEVADERVSLWTRQRPVMDVMRDLRHLHGYYWSRSKQGGQYVYSLWQDAQSRAREEAELQRLVMQQQREFQENLQKHLWALRMSEAELKQLGQEDPYLVAQMMHPVVRAGYQLFAALPPDQQVQLTQGRTPSHVSWAGHLLALFPLETFTLPDPTNPGAQATVFYNPDRVESMAPRGDVVTLLPAEMTPEQRAAVTAILRGALEQREKELKRDGNPRDLAFGLLRAAQPETAAVSLFRWGDPNWQGLSLRVDFRSNGRPWALYSNIAVPLDSQKFYNDSLRRGDFRVWPGAQQDVEQFLGGKLKPPAPAAPQRQAPDVLVKPDPILDSRVSVTWKLARSDGRYALTGPEVLAALHRDISHPIVLDTVPDGPVHPADGPAEFRVQDRPLRELLHQLFPRREIRVREETIVITDPQRLRQRLNQVPPTVEAFLKSLQRPFSLDDMVLLARSLTPWQIVKLQMYLPQPATEQMVVLQDLLRLYGELSPAQRNALPQGLAFTSLTPPQQASFLAFAQRQRPFAEPWRFQRGSLSLTTEAVPVPKRLPRIPPTAPSQTPVARVLFHVRFHEDDAESFPLNLYSQKERQGTRPLAERVGQPFPFSSDHHTLTWEDGSIRKPARLQAPLQGRPLVILIAMPFSEPFVGAAPPPALPVWARGLAGRLRDAGVTVVQVTVGSTEAMDRQSDRATGRPGASSALTSPNPTIRNPQSRIQNPENLIQLVEPGSLGREAFYPSGWSMRVEQSPTAFVVRRDGIVSRAFEGQDAWDAAAVERAAREAASHRPTTNPLP
jgi:hypothetical protein